MNNTHVLYRMYNADNSLLYVGITNNPKGRILGHQADKDWWPAVDHITLEHFPDRASLEAAEKVAVSDEGPRFNITLTPYTTAWCRAKGHETEKRGKKCQDCADFTFVAKFEREEAREELLLEQEFGQDALIRSFLGIDPPSGEENLTAEEVRATPAWQRFEAMFDDISVGTTFDPKAAS